MKLITKAIDRKLRENYLATLDANGLLLEDPPAMKPVVKLFYPAGASTWLLTHYDGPGPNIVFGLCDLGNGCPELGCVSLIELMTFTGKYGIKIERDMHFKADKSIDEYAKEARAAGRIVA